MAGKKGRSGGARPNSGPKPKHDRGAIQALLNARMDLKAEAEKYAPAALARIVQLIGSSDERVALSAAETILDRAFGKAAQIVDSKSEVTVNVEVSDARRRLAERVVSLSERRAEATVNRIAS